MPGVDPRLDLNVSGLADNIGSDDAVAPEPEGLPTVAGYQLFSLLGKGGMGTVYKARQLSTNRDVALKLMRSDVTRSSDLRELFAQEVRLAARLVHPNVVRIYDSGIDCGLYYYAMELIEGETLDRYRFKPLSRRQILELMRRVCQGVHHAHLRGVIHRDLKPRNIMVTADGRPHVLDFGLATVVLKEQVHESREMVHAGSESSPAPVRIADMGKISSTGDFAGTPAFMSPEQTRGRPDELDIRTDVYSLGVTLYLLLTGRTPHDIQGGAATVMGRVSSQPVLAPRQVDRNIDAELEVLLLKSLAFDREERYASAGAMADDLGRYLNRRPLLAIGYSPVYVLRKWLTRHRTSVSVLGCLMLLIAGLGAYSYLSHRALQRSLADGADYDQTLNNLIARLSPQVSGRQMDNRDLLNSSAGDAIHIFHDRPAKLAAILDQIGVTLLDQGWSLDAQRWIDQAVDLQEQSSGALQPDSIRMINDEAEVKREVGKSAESAALSRRALALAEGLAGSEDQSLRAQIELAYTLDEEGHPDEAARSAQAALLVSRQRHQGQPNHPDILQSLNTLAFAFRDLGRFPEARQAAWQALSARVKTLGEAHPDTIRSMDVYATILCLTPDADSKTRAQARDWIDRAAQLSATTLGLEHSDRLDLLNHRGTILCHQGDFQQATQCLREALDSGRRLLGEENRSTLLLMTNLANVLCAWADEPGTPPADRATYWQEAKELLTQLVQVRSEAGSSDEPAVLVLCDRLARVDCAMGELTQAQSLYERTLHTREKYCEADDPALVPSVRNLARVMEYQQNWAAALPLYERVWKMLEASQGAGSEATLAAQADVIRVREKITKS